MCNNVYGGDKVVGTLSMPKPKKAMFPEELERDFIKNFNESQPNAVNKAVSVHILRNWNMLEDAVLILILIAIDLFGCRISSFWFRLIYWTGFSLLLIDAGVFDVLMK